MSTPVFVIATLLLIGAIVRQLIIMYTNLLSLQKDAEISRVKVKEEKEYLFIKGLY
ncbi:MULTISPECIES: hypothetical protein [unclassified Chitinophaga]|uniref:hypothetical protein n=1 Tax=unclassified Chitinophaga TaxID=2619133 RepID=UPI0015C3898F|nr:MULTISPECIES: hypothetical protein [unclassified Chitinophaga]WPV66160.1 hypothetical protein QQL36_30640 [Chitinophaga sp. LS1]